MNKYIIAVLLTGILVLGSFLFRANRRPVYTGFPVHEEAAKNNDAPILNLYLFFSKNDCISCIEIIQVLNKLPAQYKVVGFVPEAQLKDEDEIKRKTGAAFELRSRSRYKKYIPYYTPTIIGVSQKGTIFFILPGVPDEIEYLEKFLDSFYIKNYSGLEKY